MLSINNVKDLENELNKRAGLKLTGDLIGEGRLSFDELVQAIDRSDRGKFTTQEVLDQVMFRTRNNGVGFKW